MVRVDTILNNVLDFKLQASSFKLIRVTQRHTACSLQLVAVNSRMKSFQLIEKRN